MTEQSYSNLYLHFLVDRQVYMLLTMFFWVFSEHDMREAETAPKVIRGYLQMPSHFTSRFRKDLALLVSSSYSSVSLPYSARKLLEELLLIRLCLASAMVEVSHAGRSRMPCHGSHRAGVERYR
jgi:hypothetical protein